MAIGDLMAHPERSSLADLLGPNCEHPVCNDGAGFDVKAGRNPTRRVCGWHIPWGIDQAGKGRAEVSRR